MKLVMRIGVVAFAALAMVGLARAEEWRLAKDEAGIRVYLSEVPGSKYQAYRGVVTMKTDMAVLLALQEDVGSSCSWIYQCSEQKLLKHEGGETWTYTRFKMPWPVTARDSILHVTTQRAADGTVTRTLEGEADYLPEEDGFVRVSKVEGFWTLKPAAQGEVEVVYQLHTEPGGSVPSWLANKFVVDSPYNTLSELRRLAERPR